MAAYDVGAKTILMFMIAVNVSLFWISSSQVLPVNFTDEDNPDSPVTNPSDISGQILSLDLSSGNLILAGTGLTVAVIVGWAAGSLVFGGVLGVGIFAFTLISPIISWILFGLPKFMDMMGVPSYVNAGVMALLVVPLFFTVLSFIAQRPIEGHG